MVPKAMIAGIGIKESIRTTKVVGIKNSAIDFREST